jgi:hypothetical protein
MVKAGYRNRKIREESEMTTRTKRFLAVVAVALIGVAGFAMAAVKAAPVATLDERVPALPEQCVHLQVADGNKPIFHVYATGVQIYRWNGAAWVFVAPDADLFADGSYQGLVGTHYAGPTWTSNSGSTVVAAKTDECTPDLAAIPWLKLRKVTAEGPGIFGRVSFIQRVNTTGGLKPTGPGLAVGNVAEVPYTAEYYFYRGPSDPATESN